MASYVAEVELDDIDRAVLDLLQTNCRISNADISRRVHLSPPAVHARIRRLEESGLITRYVGLLDRERAGFDMMCFVHIGLQLHQADQVQAVRDAFTALPEVLECYHLTGEFDYLLKIVVRNRKELERFASKITPIPGVARIQTSLVLTDVKAVTKLPL
ncbi:MAG: Lrp/AsnC family transcriptional regulator [Acidobacteriota bacterium]|nr:Lrp/AsnC family transcriptional regulator [Acidobacteriota bacterium]